MPMLSIPLTSRKKENPVGEDIRLCPANGQI